jgi:hypothetical protein
LKLKELIKKPPLILALVLAVTASVFVFYLVWDNTQAAVGEEVSRGEASVDQNLCSMVKMPLDVEVQIQNVIENQGGAQENGGLVEVQFSMTPLLETSELSWHLELPEGVLVNSGPGSWTGMASKDQTGSFLMTLSVPDGKEYHINAVSQYVSEDGVRVRRGKLLKVDLGVPEPPANPHFYREDEQGRGIRTYRGNVTGGGQ